MKDTASHDKTIDELVGELLRRASKRGSSGEEARKRLETHGPNELTERPRPGFFTLLLEQFNNFLVIILIVAAVVTVLLGEYIDAIAITVIIVLNAVVGVIQESKAEKAIAALKKMAAPHAQVIRDGRQTSIPAPGAGGRRHRSSGGRQLRPRRHAPGGERQSQGRRGLADGGIVPVEKNAAVVLDGEIPLGDRKNAPS